jgi:hypothetical protein
MLRISIKWLIKLISIELPFCNIRVKSNRDQPPPPPGQPTEKLTFEKIIGQMPCYRGSPGSGILAKIKFNKYLKIKKNEK